MADLCIVRHVNLREPSTFSRVYRAHAAEVEAVARRILGDPAQAQDVTHDVFLRLWMNPEAYDPRRSEIGRYLRLLARSRALDAQRSRRAAGRAGDRLRASAAVATPAWADAHERRTHVFDALRKLPGPQREALVLAYWADMRDHEVARRSGVPVGTAKSRIRLGLLRLRRDGELELAV
jgi:RNA polymerase sigma-70 factor, ECF subfamily